MIEYIVNKEKHTVAAIIKFDEHEETFKNSTWIYDDLESALRLFKRREYSDKKYHLGYDRMIFPKYMSVKVKCNPEDEWDEERGKRVARFRLVEKIKKYRNNSYKIITNLIEEIRNSID